MNRLEKAAAFGSRMGMPKQAGDEDRLEAAHKARTGLGPLESAYIADAIGARSGERKVNLLRALSKSPDYPYKDSYSKLLLAANNANFGKSFYERIDRGASRLAENPKLRLLSAIDPTSQDGLPGLVDITSGFGGSAESIVDSKRRAGEAYAKFLKKHQDKLDPNAKPTDRETPWHVNRQAVLANLDSDVAGHTYMRNESPYHYWLNPMSKAGPIKEIVDRFVRRSTASGANPESHLGRFAATAATPLTLGLAPLILGGEAAQQKLRSAAVKNNLYAPEAQPEMKAASLGAFMNRFEKAASFGALMGKSMGKRARVMIMAGNINNLEGAGKGALIGSGIGALGGAIYGAIRPGHLNYESSGLGALETEGPEEHRKNYMDDKGNIKHYYVDDKGNVMMKRRGILGGSVVHGLAGGLLGAFGGGMIGSFSPKPY